MIWESRQNQDKQNSYTKHYIYENNSFVPLLQAGYAGFIKLIETPDYERFKQEPYSIQQKFGVLILDETGPILNE